MNVLELMQLPNDAAGMGPLAKELMLKWRAMAKKHGITIDGNIGIGNSLPRARKSYMLFGGWLIPAGGQKGLDKLPQPFQHHAEEFIRVLVPDLQKLQIQGLNDDLTLHFEITVDTAPEYVGRRETKIPSWHQKIEDVTPNALFEHMTFNIRHDMPAYYLTWELSRT